MDLVRFVMSKPGAKAWSGPFADPSKTPSISIPSGQGIEGLTQVPVPQSGMERAEWIDVHGAQNNTRYGENPRLCSSSSMLPAIGALERNVLGASRDDFLGGMIVRSHNWYDFNDPATETADNAARTWNAQTSASNGLWDENNEVYTSQDSETIWA
jgi:hypothetical protein